MICKEEVKVSYRIMLTKSDHTEVFSIYCFETFAEAVRYIRWVFRDIDHQAVIVETDCKVNVKISEDGTWRLL